MAKDTGKAQIPWTAILKAFSVLAALLPALAQFIKTLEGHDVPGPEKKAGALAFLEALLRGGMAYTGEITEDIIAAVMAMADTVIGGIVAAYNAAKIFVHKGA